MTKRLNQDPLENLFSIVRQKGGNNNNPTMAELNTILARVMSLHIVQSTSVSNCEVDEDYMLTVDMDSETIINSKTQENEQNLTKINFEADELTLYFPENGFECQDIPVDITSMRYFVGYVAFKILPKLNCNSCNLLLRKEDEVLTSQSEMFIFQKNYCSGSDFGNLMAPSDLFFDISKKHIFIFSYIFDAKPEIYCRRMQKCYKRMV